MFGFGRGVYAPFSAEGRFGPAFTPGTADMRLGLLCLVFSVRGAEPLATEMENNAWQVWVVGCGGKRLSFERMMGLVK